MRTRTYKTLGIVIKRKHFGEADKLLTIFTRNHGKVCCLAKGIRKLTSRKAASLELFNLTTIFLAKGKNLDIITETEIVDSFSSWRKVFSKVALAYQFCELVDRLTAFNQAHQEIFYLLKESLEALTDKEADLANFNIQFKKQILQDTGFGLPPFENIRDLDNFIEQIIEKKINSNCLIENH